MSTRVASVIVAGLSTKAPWVDHFVVQCATDINFTNIVGTQTSKAVSDGLGNNLQHDMVLFKGLVLGQTYYYRAGVVAPVTGAITWSSTYSAAAGITTGPSCSYTVQSIYHNAGFIARVIVTNAPATLNHFEAIWTYDGSSPQNTGQPLWRGHYVPNQSYFEVPMALGPGGSATLYVRAVDTTHNNQNWVNLGSLTGGNFDPVNSGALGRGWAPSTQAGYFAWTATATSATLWWDGSNGSSPITILRMDGTNSGPFAYHQSFTNIHGPTPPPNFGFSVWVFPFYNEANGVIRCVNSTDVPGLNVWDNSNSCFGQKWPYVARFANERGYIPLVTQAINIQCPLASGNGGGTVNGSNFCIRSSMLVRTKDRGLQHLKDCKIGDWIACRGGNGWTQIATLDFFPCSLFIRTEVAGNSIEETPTHGIVVAGEHGDVGKQAFEQTLADYRIGPRRYRNIETIKVVRTQSEACSVGCSPYHEIWCGETEADILTHNLMYIS